MFWLSDEPLSCTVTLHWHREEQSSSPEPPEETVVEGALWRQIGKLHYLSYLEPSEENGASGNGGTRGVGTDGARPGKEMPHTANAGEVGSAKGESGDEQVDGQVGEQVGDRTTLKLEPSRLTLIRQGSVRWNAVFEAGRQHHAAMIVGGMSLPVETRTQALAIDLRPDGGSVDIEYELRIGDWPQHVRLKVEFHRNPAPIHATHQEV